MRHAELVAATIVSAVLSASPAIAQDDNFYQGKTVTILVGVSAGGEYDLHTRMIARHIGKHLPGKPTVIAQNMTGAGGIIMNTFLFNRAPQDGTHLGVVQNGFPAVQAIGKRPLQFDMSKFHWIGAISPTVETMVLWKTAGARSVEDARLTEIPIGSVGNANITHAFPMLLNEFAGTKFKMITGYRGGNDINLAMESGEVGGRNNTWSSWKATRRHWIDNKDIIIIAYGGPRPSDIGDVPSLESFAQTDEDRMVMRLILSGAYFGRPLVAPPGVSESRVAVIRKAFMNAMQDPDFRKEAAASRIEVDPIPGEDMAKIVREILAYPEAVRKRAGDFAG